MQLISALRRLISRADSEPSFVTQIYVPVTAFRYAAAGNGEVFLLIAARCVCIDRLTCASLS